LWNLWFEKSGEKHFSLEKSQFRQKFQFFHPKCQFFAKNFRSHFSMAIFAIKMTKISQVWSLVSTLLVQKKSNFDENFEFSQRKYWFSPRKCSLEYQKESFEHSKCIFRLHNVNFKISKMWNFRQKPLFHFVHY